MSLWLLYLVAINVFLSTSLFDRVVNQDPITLDIHYARGWSVFPGTIHAENLSIRSSDSNVEWLLKLDTVEFDISFLALPRRRFTVERARGNGISMRARTKLSAWPLTTEEIANLPPIDGFPAFSVAPAGPHHPELWDDDQYALITVRLEDVIAEDVREVWINDARYSGHARIDGRFYLKPLRGVDIGPCHIGITSGQVNAGFGRVIAEDLGGTLDLTGDRFDPREVHDNEALRYFTIATDAHARSAELSTLPFVLPAGVYTSGIIDAKKLALHIDHGRLATGTDIQATASRLVIARDGYIGEGALDIHAKVEGDRLRGETGLAAVRVIRSDAKELLRAAHAYLRIDSADLDLATTPFEDLHVGAEAVDAVVEDARVANCILPCTVRVHEGSATMNAHVEAWPNEKRLSASAHLVYADVRASMPTLEGHGSGDIAASFGSFDWGTGIMEGVAVSGALRDGAMTSSTLPLRRGGMKSGTIAARVPRLALADPLAGMDATIAIAEGSDVDVDLLVADKIFHVAGDVGVDARVTLADHELGGFDARIHAPDLHTSWNGVFLRAGVVGTARSEDGKAQTAHIALDDLRIGKSGTGVLVRSVLVDARANGKDVDVDARVVGGTLRDASALAPLLPEGIALAGDNGHFDADTRVSIHGDITRARVKMATTQMGIRTEKVTAVGDARIGIDVRSWNAKTRILDLGPSRVALTNVHGNLGTARSIEMDGVAKNLDLASPDLGVVDAHVRLEDVEVPDARVLQALLSEKTKLRILSGALSAKGELAFAGASGASGTLAIDAKHAGVAIEKSSLEGDLSFRGKLGGVDTVASNVDLSGTRVALRNIEVKNAAAETRGWRGDVVLDKAAFGWADGVPSLGADMLLTADDARPIVGMLLRDNAPKVLAGLVAMPNLALRGRLDASPDEVALTDFYVHGGDVALRGSYAVRDGQKKGAFVVSKSGLAVGIRVGGDGAHPKFFGLDNWLTAEEKKVKSVPAPTSDATKH